MMRILSDSWDAFADPKIDAVVNSSTSSSLKDKKKDIREVLLLFSSLFSDE
jgi:hypothetical protein